MVIKDFSNSDRNKGGFKKPYNTISVGYNKNYSTDYKKDYEKYKESKLKQEESVETV